MRPRPLVRPPVVALAWVLVFAVLPPATAMPAAANRCAVPAVAYQPTSAQTIAGGVTALAGQVTTPGGPVDVHLVRADLSRVRLRVVGRGATGSIAISAALAAVPEGIAGVNGDLFHVTPAGSSVAPDGPQADRGTLVKAGAGEADVLTATASGIVAIATPRFAGTVTIADSPSGTASANALVADGSTAPRSAPPRPATVQRPAHRTVTNKRKPARRHRHARRRHHRHRRRRHVVAHPTTQPPGGVTIVPTPPAVPGATGPPPPPSAVVTLDGLNDVDGPMTAVLVTSEWGSASLADELPSGVVEVLSDGTKITGVRSGSAITVPEPGSVGLVLSAAARNSIPWLAIGDPLVVHTDLAAPTGPAATAIGGNARLVAAGVVDPSCSLEGDTSRRPRVAVGLYDSNRTLLLVVSDGDAPSEPGLTLGELASLVRALGADDALNLDGGQSSTLTEHINGSWDEVNNGSGDRWVANVLALVPA